MGTTTLAPRICISNVQILQHNIILAGWDLDDLDRELSVDDLSVRCVNDYSLLSCLLSSALFSAGGNNGLSSLDIYRTDTALHHIIFAGVSS